MVNRIEVSRQTAGRLHQEALQRGCDPTEPYLFACKEAERRELAIERVPVDDVRLHGGRALYDPDALLILHENDGDDFTQAFLVAHELGHIISGGQGESLWVEEVDPLRSGESSSVGVDRVVDYSHRERREIQMDLFAREFLLPRNWVRQLHLEDELSASEIAKQCKAPFPVVAQQLLDALLLPEVEIPGEIQQPTNREPNAKQRAAIQHRGVAYLLEAGPGTGKTQTLVNRVDALVQEGVDPEALLVLTFSNKAANELSERIAATNPVAATAIWAGTFHAFGLDLVRRFHDLLGLPSDPRLLDRSAAIALLEQVYPSFQLTHLKDLVMPSKPLTKILDAISRSNDEVVDADEYTRLSQIMLDAATEDDSITRAEKCVEVAQVYRRYEELKLEGGFIDFGDLVSMPVRLCESHEKVAAHLSAMYEHILVDEFQDVNRASVRLLKTLAGNGENLWAVGDAKQSIYRFRGASSFNMSRFLAEDFPGSETGHLDVNYRSVPEITGAFSRFASTMRAAATSHIDVSPERDSSDHPPEHHIVESTEQEVEALADAIDEMCQAGYELREQAILCTGQDRLSRMGKALERMGIPVLHLGNLFERDEIRDLLCLCSLIVDSRAMGLLRAGSMAGCETSLADISTILDHLRESGLEPLEWADSLDEVAALSDMGKESLARIGKLIEGFQRSAEPWKVLTTVLLDRSRIAAEIHEEGTVKSKANGIAIWQFLNFIHTQPRGRGLPITRLLDRIRQMVLHSDERGLRNLPVSAEGINAVRLMTMHASKGLEFPVVHLPGLTGSSIPRSANASMAKGVAPPDGMIDGASGSGHDAVRDGLEEEQECLFFVALSRAKDRLFLYRQTKTANGRSNPASKFIASLGNTIQSQQVVPNHVYVAEPGDGPVPVSLNEPFTFTDRQLALYERCPRRFLYTHVLKAGGRRTESSFTKLHLAVQEVVNDLLSRLDDLPDGSELDALLQSALESHGFGEDDDEYEQVAQELIAYFVASKTGLSASAPDEATLPFPGGNISVTPDQLLRTEAGHTLLRRVKTGHKLSTEDNSLEVAVLEIAAQSYSTSTTAQVVYLSDQKVTDVELTDRKRTNRTKKLASVGNAIRSGEYPVSPSVTCPQCPAYFVCGPLPIGEIRKKISN